MKKICFCLAAIATLMACQPHEPVNPGEQPNDQQGDYNYGDNTNNGDSSATTGAVYDYSATDTVRITFEGSSVNVINPLTKVSVTTENGITTIRSSVKGVYYILSGTSQDAAVWFYSDKKMAIELSSLNLTSTQGSAINIQNGNAYILLTGSSSLCDSAVYPDFGDSIDAKATLFSEDKLYFYGEGSLVVKSMQKHAIATDDFMFINQGEYTLQGGKDGLHANDSIVINGGNLHISVPTTKGCQGLQADTAVTVNGGYLTITQSFEGIEAKFITFNGGSSLIYAYDDALNGTYDEVNGGAEYNDGSRIMVNGGVVVCGCQTGDAIDSNGNFAQHGGMIVANGPSNSGMNEAIDINGTRTFTGGSVLSATSGMGGGPGGGGHGPGGGFGGSSSSFGNLYNLSISASINSGTLMVIIIDDKEAIAYAPTNRYSSYAFASELIQQGSHYEIYTGGSYSGGYMVGCYQYGGNYSGGTLRKQGTISSKQTSISF